MQTKMYLGDGLYATFDGYHIELLANGDGVYTPATDRVTLEPSTYKSFTNWVDEGYPDYNTGRTFKEVMEDAQTETG